MIPIDSKETYKIFSDFYDMYVGQFSEDLEFYKTYCSKSDKIIEIGCGTGRILEYFLKSDYITFARTASVFISRFALLRAMCGSWIS